MPRAAIAVTRHQRDTSEAASAATLGRPPRLLSATRAAKPSRNRGIGGLGPAPPFAPRWPMKAMVNTTGSSMVTRSSFT